MEYVPKGKFTLGTATILTQICKQIGSFLEAGEKTAETVGLACHDFFQDAHDKVEILENTQAVKQAHAFLDGYHSGMKEKPLQADEPPEKG